ncbi:MAG: DUF3794 domain-containing protein [Clostridia bacterium]|nr:DUF3794 domain-containing protein [Clostridia bacterium]
MINEMEGNMRERGYFTVPLHERSFGVEVSGDFTLPDYQNEIRRILHVTPTVLPPAKYVGDNAVEFNGTIDYQILYVGSDGEMYSVPLSSDYSFSVPVEKGADFDAISDIFALCSVSSESVSTRVSAPRRLSIRCRIRPNVRVYGRIPAITGVNSEIDPETVYTRSCECKSVEGENAESDIISVSGVISASSDDMRVVCADASVTVGSIESGEHSIACKGNVKFNLLCISEETGEYKTLVGNEGFEGEIDIETDISETSVHVCGIAPELKVNVTEQGIECNAGVILGATAFKSNSVSYIDDVYSTIAECECSMRNLAVRTLHKCATANFTLSERIPISTAQIPENAEIICGFCNSVFDKCALLSGKYIFTGNSVFTVVYMNDKDIYSSDVSVPVRYECDGASGEPVFGDALFKVEDMRLRIAEGNLCVDAEMSVCADCMGESIVKSVDKAVFGETIQKEEGQLIVCYPASDDTLWSVAKRYKVAPTLVLGDPSTDRYVLIE